MLKRFVARCGVALWVAGCVGNPPRLAARDPGERDLADASPVLLAVSTSDAQASDEGAPDATVDASTAEVTALVSDEPFYAPGARKRAGSAVADSDDDAAVARWNVGGGATPAAPTGASPKPPHPAPRVKVDVVSVRGRVDEADVLRQARAKGYWPLRLCYEAGLRRAQKLRGTARLRFTLDKRGRVQRPKPVHVELADAQVVACIGQALAALTLSIPSKGTPEVVVEVALYPGDEPVYVRDGAGVHGITDQEAVTRTLRETWPALRRCYAEGLARDPTLWGRLAVRMRIATRGTVVEASEIESHFPDPAVTSCVCRTLGQLDGLAAQDRTTIVYPLRFGTPPGDAGT